MTSAAAPVLLPALAPASFLLRFDGAVPIYVQESIRTFRGETKNFWIGFKILSWTVEVPLLILDAMAPI